MWINYFGEVGFKFYNNNIKELKLERKERKKERERERDRERERERKRERTRDTGQLKRKYKQSTLDNSISEERIQLQGST